MERLTRRQFAPRALGFIALGVQAVSRRWLPEGPSPVDNPLKGWCPYPHAGRIHQPYSMVFLYVPWRRLEPQPGRYTFDEWEQRDWNQPAARGKYVVFRVYLDYPTLPTGVPDWLLRKGVALRRYSEHGGGWSPDYNHPELAAALERFIHALGERYDGHPRVAAIQLGLLGFWGEWHTWPRDDLAPPPELERRVIDAYRRAFSKTHLLARYPRGYAGRQSWLGYHDDYFPEDTFGVPWGFLEGMQRSGRLENWKRAPIAGEMVPRQARLYLGQRYQRTLTALKRGHFSWIGPYCPALERPPDEGFQRRCREMVQTMGYDFRLLWSDHPVRVKPGQAFMLSLQLVNQGIAPFYYPWRVELCWLDRRGRVQSCARLPVDVRQWLPGRHLLEAATKAPQSRGHYRVGLAIRDPAGSSYIRFANRLDVVEGVTVIGEVEVG